VLRFIRIYLVPGAVMQSVMIGGAYGTGREMTEYFTRFGMGGGVLGLCLTVLLIAVVFALSLAIAHRFRAYDYRRFSRVLLGRGWFLYEIIIVVLVLLVLAVITAAAGTILADEFGLPRLAGGIIVFVAVGALIFFGRSWVTTMLAFWSLLLYAVFITYLLTVFAFMDPTSAGGVFTVEDGWLGSSFKYTLYNISAIPVVLYAAMAIETHRQALIAGLVGGVIAVAPALMLHLSFAVDYPAILDAELPVYALLGQIDLPLLKAAYIIVILGTFIETAAGNIQGIIERIEGAIFEKRGVGLGRQKHALIALGIMITAVLLSLVGIVGLVAEGYGTIAWGFLFFYAGPLLTIGIYKLYFSNTGVSTEARNER
jgi:uncharacterized membrane protein YkvI